MTDTEIFLKKLKSNRKLLTKQQLKTLRGQALKGDLEGARKGLCSILNNGVGAHARTAQLVLCKKTECSDCVCRRLTEYL